MNNLSMQRAAMPEGANKVLDARSLERSNANLLHVLRSWQYVLDVGCGSGPITRGIADRVGVSGKVIGVDRSEALIKQASEQYAGQENLSFYCGDILEFQHERRFDVVTSARTLQWVASPEQVLGKMKSFLKPAGILCIL